MSISNCPFCGGEAEFHVPLPRTGKGFVRCMKRGCRGRAPHGDRDESRAVELWNKRPILIQEYKDNKKD